ncbi:carbohydrate ABC transporter permease, partial [Sinorhizobium meliloti]
MQRKSIGNILLLLLTLCVACMWAFPLYWAAVTSMKPEQEVISKTTFIPDVFNFSAYYFAL